MLKSPSRIDPQFLWGKELVYATEFKFWSILQEGHVNFRFWDYEGWQQPEKQPLIFSDWANYQDKIFVCINFTTFIQGGTLQTSPTQ